MDALDLAAIEARRIAGESVRALADELGVKRRRLSQLLSEHRRGVAPAPPVAHKTPATPRGAVSWAAGKDEAEAASSRGDQIRTLDDLLAAAEVDLTRWEVERYIVNKWPVGAVVDGVVVVTPLWQVKAWLRPLAGVATALAVVEDAVAAMADHAPRYKAPTYSPRADADLLLEVNLSDAHIGMLAWGPETGGGDYDSGIARRDWMAAVGEIIDRANVRRVSEIVIPIGNDFLHADTTVDGKGGATTRGTPQDVDTRWQRMVATGREVLVETIDALRLVAPVRVRVVPGNHDERTMVLLGEVMAAWYRSDDAVTVENWPDPMTCLEWGDVLLGYCHGHGAKDADLPMIMARKWPEAWARTRWREWHRGHKHRASAHIQMAPQLFEDQGVRVVGVPGLTADDGWHASRGYHHMRAAEGRVWCKQRGPLDLFTVWMREQSADDASA